MSTAIDQTEYILYNGDLVAAPSDLIHSDSDRYRVRIRGRPGRPSKTHAFDDLARHMVSFNATRADLEAGKPLCPPPVLHGLLRPTAVWYLYMCGQDLHAHLSPAAFIYYRGLLKNRLCGIDVAIDHARCLT